ncbi:Condensation domain-containing protein [Selenomonas ruminantium]|uniref:Condensation domain-containing protein n=1 Tax=Selenomonas ruminantium TaxID=971 RepID=A0A1M6U9M1_SELRU|nr:condensation domain-containing protein [Selenomonas ruminantium]SHK65873.1 Condensation domain-containing protein [Selenomonas ruminantium]
MKISQSLYKIRGGFTPLQFNRAAFMVLSAEDVLRQYETPEITFRNVVDLSNEEIDELLAKVMEAELRRGFKSDASLPLRLSVFHTSMNEYAVIVTARPELLTRMDVRNIFRQVMKLPLQSGRTASVADPQMKNAAEAIRAYWQKLFQHLPAKPRLPYALQREINRNNSSEIAIYPIRIGGSILSDIREKAKSNRVMMMAILQSAWALQLQVENDCRDTVLCLQTTNRSATEGVQQSLLPVRHINTDQQVVQDIVGKAFQQFIISQPYAAIGRESLQQIMDQQGEDYFDNILNFCGFLTEEEKTYTAVKGRADGTLVQENILDSSGVRLGLRFCLGENQLNVSFVYGCGTFGLLQVSKIAQEYELVLQQMLTDWYSTYGNFCSHLYERLQNLRLEQAETPDSRIILQDALSKLHLLQECDKGIIQLFVDDAKLTTYFEGDRLLEKDWEGQLAFVVKGKLARSIEQGDGWFRPLDIARENTWLNETILLSDKKTNLSAEVLTERAVVMTIPLLALNKHLLQSPVLVNNIIRHCIRQMEKYQRLWIQA